MGRPFSRGGGYAPKFIDLTCDEDEINLSDEEDYDLGNEENDDPGIRFGVEEASWSSVDFASSGIVEQPIDGTLGHWDRASVARRRGRFAGIDGSGIELRSLDGVPGHRNQESYENLGVFRAASYFSTPGQTLQSPMDQTGITSSENRIR